MDLSDLLLEANIPAVQESLEVACRPPAIPLPELKLGPRRQPTTYADFQGRQYRIVSEFRPGDDPSRFASDMQSRKFDFTTEVNRLQKLGVPVVQSTFVHRQRGSENIVVYLQTDSESGILPTPDVLSEDVHDDLLAVCTGMLKYFVKQKDKPVLSGLGINALTFQAQSEHPLKLFELDPVLTVARPDMIGTLRTGYELLDALGRFRLHHTREFSRTLKTFLEVYDPVNLSKTEIALVKEVARQIHGITHLAYVRG